MKRNNILIVFLVLSQLALLAQRKEIVAYYPEWGPALKHYYVKNIETSGSAKKITVLNYAFIEPGPDISGKYYCEVYESIFGLSAGLLCRFKR
jgi:hypothetical protein